MKILYINHYAGHPDYGMEFRPYYLAEEWYKAGHQALILGASFSHLRKKNPASLGFETKEHVNYYWIKTPTYKGNGLKRVINIFSFVARLFCQQKQILYHIKPDVIVASSTHPFDIFPAWWMAKKTNAKLVFEIHDLWPLSLIELGGMSKFHPFVLLVSLAEKAAFKLSDKIISILPNTLEHAKKFGVKKEHFFVIPNGIVLKDWEKKSPLPQTHLDAISRRKQDGKFLVGYAGAHGIANALACLMEAATLLKNHPIHFFLIGDGPEKQSLQLYANQHALTNVTFLDPISKYAIPEALSLMDALYIGWQKKPLYRFGIGANKLFDYMMAGKPIIHSVTAGNDPVREAHCGLSVQAENAEVLAAALTAMAAKSPEERAYLGENGKSYVCTHHDYSVLAKRFLAALT